MRFLNRVRAEGSSDSKFCFSEAVKTLFSLVSPFVSPFVSFAVDVSVFLMAW